MLANRSKAWCLRKTFRKNVAPKVSHKSSLSSFSVSQFLQILIGIYRRLFVTRDARPAQFGLWRPSGRDQREGLCRSVRTFGDPNGRKVETENRLPEGGQMLAAIGNDDGRDWATGQQQFGQEGLVQVISEFDLGSICGEATSIFSSLYHYRSGRMRYDVVQPAPRVRVWLELDGTEPSVPGSVEVGQATTLGVRALLPRNIGHINFWVYL
jgi:hypothetical protein